MRQKLGILEHRTMNSNLKPHEAVRMYVQKFEDWNPEAYCLWIMRSIRDVSLDYMRSLSSRYGAMRDCETHQLVKFMLYEAAMRYTYEDSPEGEKRRSKYHLINQICHGIELHEQGICADIKFFKKDELDPERVSGGYDRSKAYAWLRVSASVEAKYELQSVMTENHEQVREQCQQILNQWREAVSSQPESTQETQV